ncbi:MAG: GAF domain-containing sensor histidine kinase [Spirochaetales bacterium]|nr:GAF domain-containing sensor histidine kinase [Spirochaetales bacterium]
MKKKIEKEYKLDEQALSALYSILTVINRSSIMGQVLDITSNRIKEVMDIDIVLIFLLSGDSLSLQLASHRGASKQFVSTITTLKREEEFGRYSTSSGELIFLDNITRNSGVARDILLNEGITSIYSVPFQSRDRVAGILCIAKKGKKTINRDEKKFSALIGMELGVAVENIFLFREERRLKENLRLYAGQISTAYEEERKRIARELHDDTIQTLVALSRRLDNYILENLKNQNGLQKPLEQIQKNIDDAILRIRRFIQDLRPPTLEYPGLVSTLRELASATGEQSGIKICFKAEEITGKIAPEKELLIYRIVQEAIKNICKHSNAREAEIVIESNEKWTRVKIIDNGRGFDPDTYSHFLKMDKFGLMGMRERAHLLGGTFDITSKPGEGTVVTLVVDHQHT